MQVDTQVTKIQNYNKYQCYALLEPAFDPDLGYLFWNLSRDRVYQSALLAHISAQEFKPAIDTDPLQARDPGLLLMHFINHFWYHATRVIQPAQASAPLPTVENKL